MERVAETLQRFLAAVAATRGSGRLGTALAWSFPIWACVVGSLWCVSRAFGIDMQPAAAALLTTLAMVGLAVPTPAGVGGYHAAYQLGATVLYGATVDQAVGAALVLHLLWFGPVTAVGIACMGQEGVRLGGLQSLRRDEVVPPRAPSATAVLGSGADHRPARAEDGHAP